MSKTKYQQNKKKKNQKVIYHKIIQKNYQHYQFFIRLYGLKLANYFLDILFGIFLHIYITLYLPYLSKTYEKFGKWVVCEKHFLIRYLEKRFQSTNNSGKYTVFWNKINRSINFPTLKIIELLTMLNTCRYSEGQMLF